MSHNLIWRAVAYTADHEEIHVFVEAPDGETAQQRCYGRLAEEWGVATGFIDIYNLWNEKELRDMAMGSQEPAGLPLLESGGGNGEVFYDRNPLVLVASPRLRDVLESALREVRV
ncbi:hypothetical protein E1C95_19580 [Salmonella enterica subsp. enterica serovar Bonariensis]|nr:hypothetical protein [Salmonella enterica subsp. enterica serovar Bonariensis]ECD9291080.1 hypothetical protein [Salmonella enterica subsp. houtenae]EDR9972779.1 hypothetical protein [Salmonella enterica subsp. houtenae]